MINELNVGPATITKTLGSGRIAYTSAPLFDMFGQKAVGGSVGKDLVFGTSGIFSNHIMRQINYTIDKLLQLQGYYLPQMWHTPYAKVAVFMSRDDVDSYYKSATSIRASIDAAHRVPTVFYELRDDIPADDWETLLDDFHLPGYHRHNAYEQTADAYLSRILDIESETGLKIYFECHHGGGSGWNGQLYVRSAVEATNQLDHPVVYTSNEGSHTNDYLEPYLYKYENGSILPALNYYAFPKSSTFDTAVKTNDINSFVEFVQQRMFRNNDHVHYLLHSQNVVSSMSTNYNNLLTYGLDPIYDLLYTNPVSFVDIMLNNANNISSSFSQTADKITMRLDAKNEIKGYSLQIPMTDTKAIDSIKLDGDDIDINYSSISGDGYFHLIYLNMSKGHHTLEITFTEKIPSFNNDIDGDYILDYLENYLEITESDNDDDGVLDSLEYFRYGSNLYSADSDNDGILDFDEVNLGTFLRFADSDFDLMDDKYEIDVGHNPIFYDAHYDDDNDGLSNYQEYLIYKGIIPTTSLTSSITSSNTNPSASSTTSTFSSTSSTTTSSTTSTTTTTLTHSSTTSTLSRTTSFNDDTSSLPNNTNSNTDESPLSSIVVLIGLSSVFLSVHSYRKKNLN
ncbi:MAG: hypothetical protein INQ03_23330 [Candidatus Heimdallarchaeota archaeon]|nr:hypothetical protein [Candidatus Heimdallarchaeota archaeon]